jgi:hypothetical protein
MVDTRVCCDRSETQEAYEVACTQNWHQTGNSLTLRKQKNKEMKRLKRALFSRDADATASLWRKEHGSKAAWRAAKQLRDTRSDPCPQIVRLYAKASEPRMEQVTESAELQRCSVSITSSWVPTGVRRVRRGQLRPRDS